MNRQQAIDATSLTDIIFLEELTNFEPSPVEYEDERCIEVCAIRKIDGGAYHLIAYAYVGEPELNQLNNERRVDIDHYELV